MAKYLDTLERYFNFGMQSLVVTSTLKWPLACIEATINWYDVVMSSWTPTPPHTLVMEQLGLAMSVPCGSRLWHGTLPSYPNTGFEQSGYQAKGHRPVTRRFHCHVGFIDILLEIMIEALDSLSFTLLGRTW